jgi:hypothetical protein
MAEKNATEFNLTLCFIFILIAFGVMAILLELRIGRARDEIIQQCVEAIKERK